MGLLLVLGSMSDRSEGANVNCKQCGRAKFDSPCGDDEPGKGSCPGSGDSQCVKVTEDGKVVGRACVWDEGVNDFAECVKGNSDPGCVENTQVLIDKCKSKFKKESDVNELTPWLFKPNHELCFCNWDNCNDGKEAGLITTTRAPPPSPSTTATPKSTKKPGGGNTINPGDGTDVTGEYNGTKSLAGRSTSTSKLIFAVLATVTVYGYIMA